MHSNIQSVVDSCWTRPPTTKAHTLKRLSVLTPVLRGSQKNDRSACANRYRHAQRDKHDEWRGRAVRTVNSAPLNLIHVGVITRMEPLYQLADTERCVARDRNSALGTESSRHAAAMLRVTDSQLRAKSIFGNGFLMPDSVKLLKLKCPFRQLQISITKKTCCFVVTK